MNTKYTSGPWKTVKSKDRFFHVRTDGANFSSVVSDGILKDADARLIAAAPDLFEACLAAFKALPDSEQDSDLFWKLKSSLRKAEQGE